MEAFAVACNQIKLQIGFSFSQPHFCTFKLFQHFSCPCFHLLHSPCLSVTLIIHGGFLPPALDFLLFRNGLILSLEAMIRESHPTLGHLFASEWYPIRFFQADPLTGQSWFSQSPGLWSCCLPCSIFSGTCFLPFHRPAAKAAPSLHVSDQFFLMKIRSSRAGHNWIILRNRGFKPCLWN